MATTAPFKPQSIAIPIGVLIAAMISVQMGAALSKQLFPLVGAAGATAFRLGFSALILLVWRRPWRFWPRLHQARILIIYGLALGWMNYFFYLALARIPLGIAVAVEFTGPLTVAMVTSRRPLDFLWIVLAVAGLLVLLPLWHASATLDPLGLGFALAAGVCWGIYIIFGQKAGNAHGSQTAAFGVTVAAIAIVPIGIVQAGPALFEPALLPLALGVALLASAIPFSLEMYALTRIPTRTFGVFMSAEPALGALSGLAFLGERLSMLQWSAIACVMAASAGSAATSRGTPAAETPLSLAD